MSVYQDHQANPSDFTEEPVDKVKLAVKALDANRSAIHRWFWKGLLAFNLVLWSVTACAVAWKLIP